MADLFIPNQAAVPFPGQRLLAKIGLPVIASIGGFAAVGAMGAILPWSRIALSVDLQNVAGILAPIVFAAAVVERAIEILISPWRDGQANVLESAIDEIKKRPDDTASAERNALDLRNTQQSLIAYKAQTQRLAFVTGFALSALLSISGVHAIAGFLAPNALDAVSPHQKAMFAGVDAGLTALLLSGGANGIHPIINAVTTFFNSTAKKS